MERVQAPPGLRGDALEFEAIKMQIKAILAAPTLREPKLACERTVGLGLNYHQLLWDLG